ncbi:unnamed protein product [Penicillium salamii]|uniref:LYR motif-containing protein Cup1-like N-terminal domain-containing protein n=1 Tax=Penicillium salamii TaxID=1612424 RepID=A0A9W4N1L3_9EURO|nr:unnamed protein product [Penicillium salamii]CAG8256145.1 unnamed protein product [Penicillium salamii]CAG8261927.1 unnamed protein product [Penicillium salamii]CAG8376076.1 unnamed protein product [Penicillium salamii]CAG8400238.1 unnamed protein product [Penicillium salamii]
MKRSRRSSRDTHLAKVFAFLRFGPRFFCPSTLAVLEQTLNMTRPQRTHWLQDFAKPSQWLHLYRATLRECTYLPDPIAREYMQKHVISRYRTVSSRRTKPGAQTAHAAKHAFSVLRRANEGYQRPLEKVLLLSYGRTGKRRHELLTDMLGNHLPQNTASLTEFLAQPLQYSDGWEPPVIVKSLAIAHMQNPVVTTNRIRPLIKNISPPVPKVNSWGKEVSESRKKNIRQRWYNTTLSSLMPPIPQKELQLLDGLISGTVKWSPPKRRVLAEKKPQSEYQLFAMLAKSPEKGDKPQSEKQLFKLLAKGPEKGDTFAAYANGRPHEITARFMRRQWRRLSSLIPRQYWNPYSEKWRFVWDSPKDVPALAFDLSSSVDPAVLALLPKQKLL